MNRPISDLAELLRTLEPVLHERVFAFATVPDLGRLAVVATFREVEGLSVIVEEGEAERAGLTILFRARWITLSVDSDLRAVGLTAAVAGALGEAGIACNVVAAARHDHLFVPVERAGEAVACLRELQRRAIDGA